MWTLAQLFDGSCSVREDGVERAILNERVNCARYELQHQPLTPVQITEVERVLNQIARLRMEDGFLR